MAKRHKEIKHNFYNTSLNILVSQSWFEYIHNLQLLQRRRQLQIKKIYNSTIYSSSVSIQPVRQVHSTGQTGSTNLPKPTGQTGPLTGQTGLSKTEELHTSPTSVQAANSLVYGSRSTTSHPSASLRINLTQQGQKSTSGCPETKIGGNKP